MVDTHLLYRDSSTSGKKEYYSSRDLIKDLNLDILFKTMARDDMLIYEKVKRVVMIPVLSVEDIRYRQEIYQDLYQHTELLEKLYELAEKQNRELAKYKENVEKGRFHSQTKIGLILEKLTYLSQGQDGLIEISKLMTAYKDRITSEGLKSFEKRLSEEPLQEIAAKLNEIQYFIADGEIGYTVKLGGGMKMEEITINYCMRDGEARSKNKPGLLKGFLSSLKKNVMYIDDNADLKDDIGALTEAALDAVVKIFQTHLNDMVAFYDHFAEEIAFYMGVYQFMRRMGEIHIPLMLPEPLEAGSREVQFQELYELSMAIYWHKQPVGNTISMSGTVQTLITGANQGGKSTFLRSYGIAQVLMQCGMPVPAGKFSAPIYHQIFTHFSRRENEKLDSGRLQEELKSMSQMVNNVVPHSLFLLNESFASTTEKEGAQIAGALLRAFREKGVTTYMVTHLYQLASDLYEKQEPGIYFLVAERQENGTRTFHMIPGKPSHTSYGTDLFRKLLAEEQGGSP